MSSRTASGDRRPVPTRGVDPRAREEASLQRCAAAARGQVLSAADAQEASLFLLAAGMLPSQLGPEATRLRAAAESFRAARVTVDAGELVLGGWGVSLPRFRQGVVQLLSRTPGRMPTADTKSEEAPKGLTRLRQQSLAAAQQRWEKRDALKQQRAAERQAAADRRQRRAATLARWDADYRALCKEYEERGAFGRFLTVALAASEDLASVERQGCFLGLRLDSERNALLACWRFPGIGEDTESTGFGVIESPHPNSVELSMVTATREGYRFEFGKVAISQDFAAMTITISDVAIVLDVSSHTDLLHAWDVARGEQDADRHAARQASRYVSRLERRG